MVFEQFKVKQLFCSHCDTPVISFVNISATNRGVCADTYMTVSSANKLHLVSLQQFGKSLTYKENNSGPKIDP